jgi:predicted component of type VI protein secretion system
MPKLVVSIDDVVVKEVLLSKDRSTIGRRPHNDIVVDNLAASGEHAALHLSGGHATLEDLGSTNGTYVNGQAIKKQALAHNDVIEIGKYKIRYLEGGDDMAAPAPLTESAAAAAPAVADDALTVPAEPPAAPPAPGGAKLRILSGSNVGHEMTLTKIVTTVGKPGMTVASLIHKPHGYEIANLEGEPAVAVNGDPVGGEPVPLKNRDQIELCGVRLEFFSQAPPWRA